MGVVPEKASARTKGVNTLLKIYTYMCSGKLIIATRLSTHCRALDQGSAVLCDPMPQAVADAIRRTLRNPQAAVTLAAQTRRRVEAQYRYEAFEGKLLSAYRSILDAVAVQVAVRRA